MTCGHPCHTIDQGAAIETMTASWIHGGYWDAHAVRMRPELVDADLENRWRLIDDVGEDDEDVAAMAERQSYDGPLSDELSKWVRDWMIRRAAYAMRVLSEIPIVDGAIVATRAVRCLPEDLRTPYGVFWSWDPEWSGGADAHWGTLDSSDLPLVHLVASIPVSSVDWQTTLLCAMDYMCGDDERELRLTPDAPLTLLSMTVDDASVTVSEKPEEVR